MFVGDGLEAVGSTAAAMWCVGWPSKCTVLDSRAFQSASFPLSEGRRMFLAEASIQLVPDGTLLIHLLMVAVMVIILNRTLLKPINKILADREKYILGRIEEAKDLIETAGQKRNEYEAGLKAARTEGYHLLERERAQAVREKDDKIRAFKEETNRKVAQEIESTKKQQQQVRSELEAQAGTLSAMITQQILKR